MQSQSQIVLTSAKKFNNDSNSSNINNKQNKNNRNKIDMTAIEVHIRSILTLREERGLLNLII